MGVVCLITHAHVGWHVALHYIRVGAGGKIKSRLVYLVRIRTVFSRRTSLQLERYFTHLKAQYVRIWK